MLNILHSYLKDSIPGYRKNLGNRFKTSHPYIFVVMIKKFYATSSKNTPVKSVIKSVDKLYSKNNLKLISNYLEMKEVLINPDKYTVAQIKDAQTFFIENKDVLKNQVFTQRLSLYIDRICLLLI